MQEEQRLLPVSKPRPEAGPWLKGRFASLGGLGTFSGSASASCMDSASAGGLPVVGLCLLQLPNDPKACLQCQTP